MLKGNQKKLDKNKNNRIDSEDFELLRAGKKRGGVMKAKRGRLACQDFSERMKNVEKGLINKKTGKPTSMDAMRQLKGFKTGELPKEFNKRRMALAGAKEALKRTRIGKIALGVAGAGLAAKAYLDKKKKEAKEKKQNKKMGGGMMKRYNKGGGADTGTVGEMRSRLGVRINKAKRLARRMKDTDRLTERDIAEAKKAVSKKMGGGLAAATERLKAQGKMGGGMMKPQKAVLGMLFRKKKKATPGMKMVESSPGGFGLLGRLAKKVGLQKGGGADTGRMGEIKSKLGVATNQINRMKIPGRLTQRDKEALKEISKIKGRKFKPLSTTQRVLDALKSPKPVAKKMGGGMMQPAMPMYKKGKMIKARGGGLAKTKPTKMY